MSFIRTIGMLGLTAALLAPVTGCGLVARPTRDTSDIVIGADLELSGAAAPIGIAYDRALRLRVEQLNRAGGIDGRRLRLDVRDNRSDTNLSLKNISDFTDDGTITALITGACSQCVVAAARTINEREVPTVALSAATNVGGPVPDRRYVFKVAPNAADDAATLTTELRRVKATSVALLVSEDAYGADGQAAMAAELAKAGIALRATQRVKATATDVSQPVATLAAAHPDAIVVWTLADQAGLAATSARAAGFDGRLFFDAGAAGDLFLADPVAAAADGAVMVFTQTMVIDDVIATTPVKAARKQWFRDYTARHGSYYGYASFAADALTLLTDAIARAGTNRERIRDIVETSQLDGLSGAIRLTPDNHSGLMPQALTLLVARNGRWRLLG